MNTIITATDFTDIANNAVYYACDMAAAHQYKLIVLHSYNIPLAVNEIPMPASAIEETKDIAEEQLTELVDKLFEKYPELGIEKQLTFGDITDNLLEAVTANHAQAVIVGNSNSDEGSIWLGGNLLNTLRHLPCPVIAIPADYKYRKVEKIAFACDFHHISETLPANDLVTLVQQSGAQLHVLNVDHENSHFDTNTSYEFSKLDEMIHVLKPEYHHIDNEGIEEGIDNFISGNNADWLVLVPHKRNFFESLFHKSQTKTLVKHATIPIVALHEHG